ncbi:NADH:flavin oxidoreductase/NADH oxidase [Blastocladiella britannica]|nr:NADH:flavin oxidoreductase/NADH oxidase [Blastocladiella britannica]
MTTSPADFRVQQTLVPGQAKSSDASSSVPALFRPLTIRGTEFANRIWVAPMCMFSASEGVATDFHLVNAGQYALRGASLFMVEATAVSAYGRISTCCLGLWNDAQVAPLARIADFVHSTRNKIGIQIAHAGRKGSANSPYANNGRTLAAAEEGGWPDRTVAPSPVAWSDDLANPLELSVEQIAELVEQFKESAVRADRAGFDVVEIHGAHGYLIHQFLSPLSNLRTDKYGGPLDNRARFLYEVTEAVRAVWPAEKPLFVRLSCTDWVADSSWDIDEVVVVLKKLHAMGVDVADCSSGGAHPAQKIPSAPGYQVPFAERIKREVPGMVVATVGLITTPTHANAILEDGRADVVMMAREFLRDSWIYRAGKELGADVAMVAQYQRGA